MIELGTTLRCNQPPRHIWIVLSDPEATAGQILFVNLTTLRDSSIDDTCILGPEDYIYLSHRTTVAYSRAVSGSSEALERAIQKGDFCFLDKLPKAALRKAIEGAHKSRELSEAKKKLLPDNIATT
ncbi:MAG: hypothetical protein NTX50_10990 [Candidatus Sumerlaeota bacterium]|nr:hypothetical protein [Candidatus Sumerlaeota bacterium]